MGWFKKHTDPEELERLKSEIALMSARLSASDQQKHELDEQVRGLVARLDTPPPPTEPPPPPPAATPSIDPAEIDMLHAKIERLSIKVDDVAQHAADTAAAPDSDEPSAGEQIEQLDDRLERVSARVEEIDQRITSISTELANQLSELSSELDKLSSEERDALGAGGGEVVEQLRDSQTRLAEEQARYQIAFRRDLAELADRLKRS